MRREKIEVETDFTKTKGLSQLKGKWMDFAGDLLEPAVLLAAGATKAQAAWAGMRGMFEARVLGPLGLVAAASLAFLGTTKLLISRWKELGMAGAGALERMTLQFRPLLGSLDSAKERVKELQTFAVVTPFELDEIVAANKMLEVLTQGAMSGTKGMTQVGDAASVAGEEFSTTARQVGRLYDGLMSGRPVGEATMRLQEMGIINGTVRNQIESMQAANASGLKIWKVVEKQLDRNTGAMEEQSKVLEGLQSTHSDTQNQMQAGFSKGFLDGEKAGVESSIKMMESMTPVLDNLGKELGSASSWWARFRLSIVDSVTSVKGFSGAIEFGMKAVVGLAAVLAGASSVALVAFTVRMLKLMAGNKAVAASSSHLAAIESAQIPILAKLRSVRLQLAGASAAHAAGMKAEAAAHMSSAAAGAKNLVATNGMLGVVSVGRKAFTGLGMAVGFVGAQLRMAAVAMFANPMVWMMGLVVGLAMAFSKLSQMNKKATESLESYVKAAAASDSEMKKQIAEIRTMIDLRQAESKILTQLTGAYKAMDDAKTEAERDAAKKHKDNILDNLDSLPKTGGLEKDAAQLALEKGNRAGAKKVKEMDRDAIAAKGPEEARRVTLARLDEANKKRKEAIDLVAEEARIAEKAAAARKAGVSDEALAGRDRRQKLETDLAALKAAQKGAFSSGMGGVGAGGADVGKEIQAKFAADIAEKTADLDELNAKMKEMATQPGLERLSELLASPSELQQIKAKIEAFDAQKASLDALATAEEAYAQEKEGGAKKDGLHAAVAEKKRDLARDNEMAVKAGVSEMGNRGIQGLKVRRDELEENRAADMDPATAAALALADDKARVAVASARLDSEAAIAGLRLKGYEREEKLLEIEREKLSMKFKGNQLGQDEYNRQEKILRAREEALAKDGRERAAELGGALMISKLKRKEDAAREQGDQGLAENLRKRREAVEEASARKDAKRDAEGAGGSPEQKRAYVENRMKEEREGRDAARRREEESRKDGRNRSEAGQRSAVADMQAGLLKRQGKGKEAKALKEKAARESDELDRKDARKGFIAEGFGAEEADEMANKEVKMNQADRMMADLTGRKGTVVASSLAKVGGGGGVTGRDPNLHQLERIAKILEDVRDTTKENVDNNDVL